MKNIGILNGMKLKAQEIGYYSVIIEQMFSDLISNEYFN